MDRTCGACRFFRVTEERDDSRIGTCRLEKVIGVFRESMRGCASFAQPGDMPVIGDGSLPRHSGRARTAASGAPVVPRVPPEALAAGLAALPPQALKALLIQRITHNDRLGTGLDLGRQWEGGVLIFWSADDQLKPKEMPFDQFLHKLVMIRDNLRVLEQKVNSHGQLHDAERIDLQRQVSLSQAAVFALAYGWSVPPPGEHQAAWALLDELQLEAELHEVPRPLLGLAERWHGGRVRYAAEGIEIEEPLERFYFRLLRLRGRLMNLEADLTAHPHLGESDGDVMSGYIRRSYGSLTSFNVLLKDRDDYFTSGR